jgi:hypothetical protein
MAKRMSMTPVWVALILILRREGSVVYEDGAEKEVLHHGQFAKDLREVHLLHTCVDFVPCFDLGQVNMNAEYEEIT